MRTALVVHFSPLASEQHADNAATAINMIRHVERVEKLNPNKERFTSYERNLLGSCENWLRTRSSTKWAIDFCHTGLMNEYAVGIKTILGNGGPNAWGLCEDCPPVDYPTEARCAPCPRRSQPMAVEQGDPRIGELQLGNEDTARMDWLEGEIQREILANREGHPMPKSIFRRNVPITRQLIDKERNGG